MNLLSHRQANIALAFVSCSVEQEVRGGDHALLFGRAVNAQPIEEPPLVYAARLFETQSSLIADRQLSIADAISACAN